MGVVIASPGARHVLVEYGRHISPGSKKQTHDEDAGQYSVLFPLNPLTLAGAIGMDTRLRADVRTDEELHARLRGSPMRATP